MSYSPDYDMTNQEIESELDSIYPDWDAVNPRTDGLNARGKPFDHLTPPFLRRVKWLLKRRLLVLKNMPEWGVLVAVDGKNPAKCYAHPIPPQANGQPSRPWPPERIAS